jgi:hypothetical protein
MEHEGWRPDWMTLDREPSALEEDASSFEVTRALEFAFCEPSSIKKDPESNVQTIGDDDRLFVSKQRPADEPAVASRGIKKPEIPGYEILGELGRGAMGSR